MTPDDTRVQYSFDPSSERACRENRDFRDDHQVDEILKRSYHVLELSPSEHLRCQLMTYMYGETLDEQLLEEVRQTVGKWKKEDYLEEDNLMMGALTAMENNAQHYQVVEEMEVPQSRPLRI